MSDTIASLSRKISSAGDLQSVVRTMKALAAASIGQYEQSVLALGDYYRTLELGLSTCLRASGPTILPTNLAVIGGGQNARATWPGHSARSPQTKVTPDSTPSAARVLVLRTDRSIPAPAVSAIVFGSDQGLVGQFNDNVADFAIKSLAALPGKPQVWAVGERVHARLADAGLPLAGLFPVPNSVMAITPLVGRMLIEHETHHGRGQTTELHLFHNRPASEAVYAPVSQRLLPLDETWRHHLSVLPWPTKNPPEILGDRDGTLGALIRGYLFVSLFRACAESLASENASRLSAMERAERNIDELLDTLHGTFHRLRQSGIDEELFDVISGFEALSKGKAQL